MLPLAGAFLVAPAQGTRHSGHLSAARQEDGSQVELSRFISD